MKKYDFSGWATKFNVRCADGRTIMPGAFSECDGKTVPVIWGHDHSSPDKVLGHALLECKPEGVYTYVKLNDTKLGKVAKRLVAAKDITAMSIFANKLSQEAGNVVHGVIREVSLVLAGANPDALIENPTLAHADGTYDILCSEARIYYGSGGEFVIRHSDEEDYVEDDEDLDEEDDVEDDEDLDEEDDVKEDDLDEEDDDEEDEDDLEHSGMTDEEIAKVYGNLDDTEREAVDNLVGRAYTQGVLDGEEPDDESEKGDDNMKKNLFDAETVDVASIQHSAMAEILETAKTKNMKLSEVAKSYAADQLAHDGAGEDDPAQSYGINHIDFLFPDAKAITDTPSFIKRETEWVRTVMTETTHVPFSRLKTIHADITADEARAKGYIKGEEKVEEVFDLLTRSIDPQTVYKKQKLDRDDISDITSFDVVVWLKGEMRIMLDEELSRAFLIGDGRSSTSKDKIKPAHIKPIYGDADLYTIYAKFEVEEGSDEEVRAQKFIKSAIRARKNYRGSGNITAFMTEDLLTECLLLTDKMGRDLYDSVEKLAIKLRVKKIVTVPVMENVSRVVAEESGTPGQTVNVTYMLDAILVDLKDYRVGSDKGGAVSMFDDFDIDFNQYKYLIETRCSAMNCVPHSAIVVEHKEVAAAG